MSTTIFFLYWRETKTDEWNHVGTYYMVPVMLGNIEKFEGQYKAVDHKDNVFLTLDFTLEGL